MVSSIKDRPCKCYLLFLVCIVLEEKINKLPRISLVNLVFVMEVAIVDGVAEITSAHVFTKKLPGARKTSRVPYGRRESNHGGFLWGPKYGANLVQLCYLDYK